MKTLARIRSTEGASAGHDDPTVNRVALVGYLGDDPEIRYLPSGEPTVTLSLATHRAYRNERDELVEATDWHRVVASGASVRIAQAARRGALLKVTGRLRTRSLETQRGERRVRTEVVAIEIQQFRRGPASSQVRLPLPSYEE